MSSTVSSSPTGTVPAHADGSATTGYSASARPGRGKLWIVLAIPVVLGVGGLSWAAVGWTKTASERKVVNQFVVTPRSFSVVLKEKGELKASNSADIACEVEGRSTIISLIPEGTAVKKGDLLIELASDQIEDRIRSDEIKEANAIMTFESAKTELEIQRDRNASDVRKGQLEIELAHLALKKYEEGDWKQDLKDANVAIEQAEITLKRRNEDFEAAKELRERNFITKTKFDEDEFAAKRAGWDLEKAKLALDVLQQYTHIADSRKRESDLEEAEKEAERIKKNAEAEELKKMRSLEGKTKELQLIQDQLAKLRTQAEKCRIFAPTQGFVVYYSGGGGRHFMSSDNQIKEGATVRERQVLLSLPDTSEMMVVVRVHETKTDKLHLDQPAMVTVEGIPGKQFTGKVTKIAVLADSQNRWLNPDLKEYETEITLEPTDATLKPGVTAHVEILVETVEHKLAVPVHTVYSKGRKRFVFASTGREIAPLEIQLGAIGTEWVEVAGGLTGGEHVLQSFTADQKRLVPDVAPEQSRDSKAWRDDARGGSSSQHGQSMRRGGGGAETTHQARPSGKKSRGYRREGDGAKRSHSQPARGDTQMQPSKGTKEKRGPGSSKPAP